MLTWVGKKPLAHVPIFPAQLVEIFDPSGTYNQDSSPPANRLYHGDNKEVLAHLLANGLRGQVKLIYIDPPFDSGADYVRKVQLRGAKRTSALQGAAYSLGEQVQYTDIWANDNYLQFMYERLPLLRELLADDGSIWLHCDHRKVHHLRMLLEETFGPDNYLNTISWRSQVPRGAKVNAFYFPYSTHYIEIFAKDRYAPTCWNPPKKQIILTEAEAQKAYMEDEGGFFRTSDPGSYSFAKLKELHGVGRLYAPYQGEIVIDESAQRVYPSNGGNIGIKYYLTQLGNGRYGAERAIDNLWEDIPGLGTTPGEDVGYPTQKTEALLERIINVGTQPGDIVLDCFMGSGTTVTVAQKLGRQWIGCDINRGSIQTVSRRLQAAIQQAENQNSFTIHRVNHYMNPSNLTGEGAYTHVEMLNLICEHVGIQRSQKDSFFTGTQGTQLAYVNSVNRPLTPDDFGRLAHELQARPDEARDIIVIALGQTVAVASWLEEWNLLRKPNHGLNHITLIDLQRDTRYGPFVTHEPAQAQVEVRRDHADATQIHVEILDFISPTVIQRLRQQAGEPQIHEWQAMVESVVIDPAYDGEIVRGQLADVPLKKRDLVSGKYVVSGPVEETRVAIKITDVLGEELLVIVDIGSV